MEISSTIKIPDTAYVSVCGQTFDASEVKIIEKGDREIHKPVDNRRDIYPCGKHTAEYVIRLMDDMFDDDKQEVLDYLKKSFDDENEEPTLDDFSHNEICDYVMQHHRLRKKIISKLDYDDISECISISDIFDAMSDKDIARCLPDKVVEEEAKRRENKKSDKKK